MLNPYPFKNENSKIGFKNNLGNHNISHANLILSIVTIHPDFGIETRYFNKNLK